MSKRHPSARPHILVVSDDPGLSSFLAEGLVMTGFWTSAIASAFQALEVFRLRTFDLVLMDAALGGPGAVETIRRLRGTSDRAPDSPRTGIPILLVAGSAGEITPEDAAAAGADHLLLAPLDLDNLAPLLLDTVLDWRDANPAVPWADAANLAAKEPH
ncbi:MAG: response regulator [Chloroflexota bacterium]